MLGLVPAYIFMASETTFLRGIQADPSDVTVRLVYADWLDECGDPRGELIRLQEEMKTCEVWSDQYQALKPRRNQIRAVCDDDWLRTLDYQIVHRPMFSRIPDGYENRFRLIEESIEIWHGLGISTMESTVDESAIEETGERLGFRLPLALRDWYLRFDQAKKVWNTQDQWLALDKLHYDNELQALIFRVENQSCCLWGVAREDIGINSIDPPVRMYESAEISRIESSSLSRFAITSLLFERIWQPYNAWTDDVHEEFNEWLEIIRMSMIPCQETGTYWVAETPQFFEANDLFFYVDESTNYLYASFRLEETFESIDPVIRDRLTR